MTNYLGIPLYQEHIKYLVEWKMRRKRTNILKGCYHGTYESVFKDRKQREREIQVKYIYEKWDKGSYLNILKCSIN